MADTRFVKLEGAWTNDNLTPAQLQFMQRFLDQPTDDTFTNDFALAFSSDYFDANARMRMVTEHGPGQHRRTDQLDVLARVKAPYSLLNDRLTITASLTLGVASTGNLGQREVQQAWHSSGLIVARTLGHGLQGDYEGGTAWGCTAGVGLRVDHRPTPELTLSAEGEARNTFGTGLGTVRGGVGAELKAPRDWDVRPFLRGSVDVVGQRVNDARLSMPGAYKDGVYLAPQATLGLEIGMLSLSYQWRWNEGGTGQQVAEVRGGVSF